MILVTGVAGHLGSALFKYLTSQGHKVVGTVHTINSDIVHPNIVKVDLTNPEEVKTLCDNWNITSCVHCAGIMSQKSTQVSVLETVEANLKSTKNLLSQKTWNRFIYISSGSVFQNTHGDIDEDTPPTPTSIYGMSKRLAELETIRDGGIVVRVSWLYGPPIRRSEIDIARGPIPWLVNCFKNDESIVVPGGDYSASFTYITDAVEGISKLLEAKSLNHSIYHVGTGNNITVKSIVDTLANIAGKKYNLLPGVDPWSVNTVQRPALSVSKIKNELGWQSRFNLHTALQDYWNNY